MLLGGDRRPVPFLIIELVNNPPLSDEEKDAKLADVWPYIEKANEKCSDYVKIKKELVMFTYPAQPFLRTVKETVPRAANFTLYTEEIEALYPMNSVQIGH